MSYRGPKQDLHLMASVIFKEAIQRDRIEHWVDLLQVLRKMPSDDDYFREMVLRVKEVAPYLLDRAKNKQELNEAFSVYKGALYLSATWDVDSYFLYLELDRPPQEQFYLPRRDKIQPIISALQQLLCGELDILTISCPPGIGKTTAGLRFMSMIMGLYPRDQCLATGHSDVLVRNFYDGVYEILTSNEYKYNEIFPRSPLVKNSAQDYTLELAARSRLKTLTCRSIGGTGLTGVARCNRLLYCDDLVSGIEEAQSKPRLDKLWSSYTDDARTRKKDQCAELHIATRWSVHDVIGRLEREYGDSPRFKSVVMDCYDENGESQFDFDYGVGFSTEYFKDMEQVMDSPSFNALFRNSPIEREGLLYQPEDLRYFSELPRDPEKVKVGEADQTMAPDAIIAVVDPKDRGKDYYFSPVAYVYGDDYYIVDCICDDGVSGLEGRVGNMFINHGVQRAQVESNSIGGKSADLIETHIIELGGYTHVTRKPSSGNKETKIIVWADWVKNHCLFLTSLNYRPGSEYDLMIKFLTSYSQKGRNKYDDVPDGMAQLAQFANSFKTAKVKAVQNPLWR